MEKSIALELAGRWAQVINPTRRQNGADWSGRQEELEKHLVAV